MARKAAHRRLPQPPPPPPPKPEGKAAAAAAAIPGRRQPVILTDPAKPSERFAEVAGGTAAGCAAICCCCPCGLVNLLVLTVVRLPAGLCRKALRKQQMKRRAAAVGKKKAGLLAPQDLASDHKVAAGLHPAIAAAAEDSGVGEGWPAREPAAEVAEMELETWAKLYSTGFWRSPSQRE